jgi:elongation factor 2
MEAVSCGSTVGLTGVDTVLLKSGSITELKASHPIAPMRFSVSPVVRRSVAPANAAQLPKFLVALRRLNKAEQGLEVIINERTSEYIIAGTGELHVEVALNAFRELLGNEISITVGDPIVEFRETVTEPSAFTTLGKSGNKHNRIYITAEPLDEAVVSFLETHEVATDPKSRASALQKAGLNPNDAKKAWTVEGTNILVDRSKAVPYLPEIRDSVEVAFRQLVEASALSGETLTGVQINVMDAKVHSDAPHRSGQQITPMARDCMRAAILCARPRMVEPVFLAEVQTEAEVLGKVHGQFSSRRGYVFHEEQKVGTPLYNMRAHLPVLESFGFAADLRGATGGRAFPQLTFDHWEVIQSDPWDEKDPLGAELIKSIRKRKGMTESVPTVDDFNMKL